ncbi:MAG: hypothetical protein CMK52_05175 [Proteobacteria bacterium]|nr:hypothetical protein [Pseudomonadota bacterium]
MTFQQVLFITCNILLIIGNTIALRWIGKKLTTCFFNIFIDIEKKLKSPFLLSSSLKFKNTSNTNDFSSYFTLLAIRVTNNILSSNLLFDLSAKIK